MKIYDKAELVWSGEINDYPKPVGCRVVITMGGDIVAEINIPDAMGDPTWSAAEMKQERVLCACIKALYERGQT